MDVVDLLVNDLPLDELTLLQIVQLSSRLLDAVNERIQNLLKEDTDCE